MLEKRFQAPHKRKSQPEVQMSDAMREHFAQKIEHELENVVREAREKNKTMVMVNRLRNPNIQSQMLSIAKRYPNMFTRPPTEIIANINATIEREMLLTHINPKIDAWRSSYNGLSKKAIIGTRGKATNQMREYIEAHEKEHAVRSSFMNFRPGVSGDMARSFSKWSWFKEKCKQMIVAAAWSNLIATFLGPVPAAGYFASEVLKSTYMHSSWEIYARMSQLKNYFGMEADEEFTAEHLEYARKHYIEDTGLNNNMQAFFDGITPRSQRQFLYTINNFGV